MKKFLIVLLLIVVLFVGALMAIPMLFGDTIRAKIDEAIGSSVNADVAYDADQFELSIFQDFPNLTASLGDVSVKGREAFEGETLVSSKKIGVSVDLWNAVFGDKMGLKGVFLESPVIWIKTLKDGKTNYDIAIDSGSEPSESEPVEFSIDHWDVTDGTFIFEDLSTDFIMKLTEIQHEGSGDFTSDLFEMETLTDAIVDRVEFEGVTYMGGKKMHADAIFDINLKESIYSFKDNKLSINDFDLGFLGDIKMPNEDIEFDLAFNAVDTDLKKLISLIPESYLKDYEGLSTEGKTNFNGIVKGVFSENSMPGFQLNMDVENGMIQYPDLPDAIKNIDLNLLVDNSSGIIDRTMINLSKIHMDIGDFPLDGKLLLKNLTDYDMRADLKTAIDLSKINRVYPLEGMELKGLYKIDVKADGIYDSIRNIYPLVDATMSLRDGFVRTSDVPIPIDDLSFDAVVKNTNRKPSGTLIDVKDMLLSLGGEKITGDVQIQDLNEMNWVADLKGRLDFAKLSNALSLDSMEIAGKLDADIKSKGSYAQVEKGNYSGVASTGTLDLSNFSYNSVDLPQPLAIDQLVGSFTPQAVKVSKLKGKFGNSDFDASGNVTNYLDYVFKDDVPLKGAFNVTSRVLNLDELMVESEEAVSDEPLEVLPVPKNVDLTIISSVGEVIYDNMDLSNAKGVLLVNNGAVDLKDVAVNTMGGTVGMNGTYDPKDIENPLFAMDLDLKNLSFKEAFNQLNTVRILAPIAEHLDGDFSSNFQLSGSLLDNLLPNLGSLSGDGVVEIFEAALGNDSKLVQEFSKFVSFKEKTKVIVDDVKMKAEIKDGKLEVKPFDLKIGDYAAKVWGKAGLDGQFDYQVALDVPAGSLGKFVNDKLSKIGRSSKDGSTVTLNLNLLGSYDQPRLNFLGSAEGAGVQEVINDKVQEEIADAKEELKDKANEQIAEKQEEVMVVKDSLMSEVTKKTNVLKDSLSKEVDGQLKKETGKVEEKAKDLLKDLFGKKKKDTTKTTSN